MRKGTLTAMTSRKLSTWRRIWGGKMLNVVLLGAAFSAWSNRSTSSNMLLISFMGYSKTSNRDSAATASIWLQPAKTSRTLFPPQCTNQQLGLIRQMLPNKEVLMEQSNCPHASWTNKKDDWLDQSKQNTDKDPRVAVFVGCNKVRTTRNNEFAAIPGHPTVSLTVSGLIIQFFFCTGPRRIANFEPFFTCK